MALQSLDIQRISATTTPPPGARQTIEVAKLIDVSKCIGCKACQTACMEWNDIRDEIGSNAGIYDNPRDLTADSWTVMRFSEVEVEKDKLEWLIRKDGCMHCADPGCLKGCPFNVPRISKKDNKAYKCTLCSDRVGVGMEPACVKSCPTGALVFGSKVDMIEHAAGRIVDLKERGYSNAGLYDPQGVGGTHVMYVLQHADQPELYHGLPKDPSISPMVAIWKGVTKPLMSLGIGLVALAGFFHFIKVGPNEVEEESESELH
jgi:formate dehydrogenase iron-sulfur subunit